MSVKYLTRAEEMLLLATWRLQDNAYGVTIQRQLKEVTGKTWAFGALFVSLDRLVKKGYLTTYLSEPTAKRGGRRKRMYRVTPNGLRALQQTRELAKALWAGIGEHAFSLDT